MIRLLWNSVCWKCVLMRPSFGMRKMPPRRSNPTNNDFGVDGMTQLAVTLAQLVQNQQPGQRDIVAEFKRLNRPIFEGATDPAIVEKWIQEMEKAFDLLGSSEANKVTLAVYQLQGGAYDWWFMEKRKHEGNPEPYTWTMFKEVFTHKYFPRTIRSQKEREFIKFEQRSKTVAQYEAEFAKLAKYAPTLVADEETKARRLEDGLRADLRHGVASFELPTYDAVFNKALVIERGLTEMERGKNNKREEPSGGESSHGGPTKKWNTQTTKFGGNQGNQWNQENKLKCSRCGKNHPGKECCWNMGACFHCGDFGHSIAQCPKNPPPKGDGKNEEITLASLRLTRGRVFQLSGNQN